MSNNTEHVLQTLRGLSGSSFDNENDRVLALREAQALCQRLESPFETLMRLTYQEPSYNFAVAVACDISLFIHLQDNPKTTDELASQTSTQPELLRRILRHLAIRGTITERGDDLWSATELSRALQAQDAAAGVTFGVPFLTKVLNAGRDYMRQKGYQCPSDPRQTFLQHLLGDNRPFWEYLQQNPDDSRDFNMQLGYAAKYHPSWLDMCDSDSLFKDERLQDQNVVAFVDIGGGIGVDAAEVRKRYPRQSMPARVILQDTAKVIEEATVNGGLHSDGKGSLQEVDLQTYDFFTSQPIQGARVYFLASIIHDWPDEDAKKILGQIAAAMKKGFSKLMISSAVGTRLADDVAVWTSPCDTAMRWAFWATEKKDEPPASSSSNGSRNDRQQQPPPTTPKHPHVSSWSSPNLPTDWRHYTSPDVVFPVVVITSSIFIARRLYKLYLRRFTGASSISPSFWRKRSLLGHVTSVGDGDGFRMFHTPGGKIAGWGLWRRIPEKRTSLRDNTISVRIAGVDAPENAHFGHPAQPGGPEALEWLTGTLQGRKVRAYIWRKDQYERAVATVYLLTWGGLVRRDVGLMMLKRGLATVYEARTGAEFGDLEERYRRAEFWAKTFRRGIWRHKAESPREFKERMKTGEDHKTSEPADGKAKHEKKSELKNKTTPAATANRKPTRTKTTNSKETKS